MGAVLRLVLLSCMALSCSAMCPAKQGLPSGKVTKLKMMRPEGERYYHVYVPSNYDHTKPTLTHFTYHGLNDNCYDFMANAGFKKLAEEQNFLLVVPCGSLGYMGIAWNSGTCCGFRNDSKTNDFEFTREMHSYLNTQLCIDKENTYASGFSNGAMMASVLGCKQADIFRAVASCSGVVELRPGDKKGLAVCDEVYGQKPNRSAELNIHGTFDVVVPWVGDPVLGFPPVPEDFHRWADRNKCSGKPVQTFKKGKFSNQVYQSCTEGTQVELVKHFEGGHEWPRTADFDTPTYIMDFFARFNRSSRKQ